MSIENLKAQVLSALHDNRNARLGGVLMQERVLVTPCGHISKGKQPELIAFIDARYQMRWYGHVFCFDDQEPTWASAIISMGPVQAHCRATGGALDSGKSASSGPIFRHELFRPDQLPRRCKQRIEHVLPPRHRQMVFPS